MHFCVCMHVQFVHTYASVIALFPCPFLSMSILTCSVKDRTGKPSTMRSPPSNGLFLQSWTRMMCHRWLCHCIPVPVLTLSNYHTNSLMRRLSMIMRAIYYYCDSELLLRSVFPHLLLLFFLFLPPSLPHTAPSAPLSYPPSLHILWWVGGKFNGDVGSQKGRGFASYHTAQYVCKSGGFLSASPNCQQWRVTARWCVESLERGERSKMCPE